MSPVFVGEAKENFQENESTVSLIDPMAPHAVTQVTVRSCSVLSVSLWRSWLGTGWKGSHRKGGTANILASGFH